jgi:hypothetical protein
MKSIFEIGQSRVRRPSIRYGLVGSIEANGCLRKRRSCCGWAELKRPCSITTACKAI